MLALKSDKSLIEKVLLFKKDDDDDLFEPAFATERLKLFINVILVVELLHLLLEMFHYFLYTGSSVNANSLSAKFN